MQVEPFQAAVALDPRDVQARSLLGMAYFGARIDNDAPDQLEIAVADQPDNIQLRFNRAQSLVFSQQG